MESAQQQGGYVNVVNQLIARVEQGGDNPISFKMRKGIDNIISKAGEGEAATDYPTIKGNMEEAMKVVREGRNVTWTQVGKLMTREVLGQGDGVVLSNATIEALAGMWAGTRTPRNIEYAHQRLMAEITYLAAHNVRYPFIVIWALLRKGVGKDDSTFLGKIDISNLTDRKVQSQDGIYDEVNSIQDQIAEFNRVVEIVMMEGKRTNHNWEKSAGHRPSGGGRGKGNSGDNNNGGKKSGGGNENNSNNGGNNYGGNNNGGNNKGTYNSGNIGGAKGNLSQHINPSEAAGVDEGAKSVNQYFPYIDVNSDGKCMTENIARSQDSTNKLSNNATQLHLRRDQ